MQIDKNKRPKNPAPIDLINKTIKVNNLTITVTIPDSVLLSERKTPHDKQLRDVGTTKNPKTKN